MLIPMPSHLAPTLTFTNAFDLADCISADLTLMQTVPKTLGISAWGRWIANLRCEDLSWAPLVTGVVSLPVFYPLYLKIKDSRILFASFQT